MAYQTLPGSRPSNHYEQVKAQLKLKEDRKKFYKSQAKARRVDAKKTGVRITKNSPSSLYFA